MAAMNFQTIILKLNEWIAKCLEYLEKKHSDLMTLIASIRKLNQLFRIKFKDNNILQIKSDEIECEYAKKLITTYDKIKFEYLKIWWTLIKHLEIWTAISE